MFSTDLSRITIEEFERSLLTAKLLPSQRAVLNNIDKNMQCFKNAGISNLKELQGFLKDKKKYTQISKETGMDVSYITIVNRMANSYNVKPLLLSNLEIFRDEELKILKSCGILNTRRYYDSLAKKDQRKEFSQISGISLDTLDYTIHIADLLRVNGIGVGYAKILYDVNVRCVRDYLETSSETLLMKVKEVMKKLGTKSTLGASDVGYCRRFCEKLDLDIEE